jgi:hypothetical protein
LRAENLENIRLRGNNIGAEGFSNLTKANWIKINMIDLGNNIFKKEIIKLETKDVLICRNGNGI